MNVKIISDYGENSFFVSPEQAMDIIKHAMDFHTRYSRMNKISDELAEAEIPGNEGSVNCRHEFESVIQKEEDYSGNKKQRRTDSLFGMSWDKKSEEFESEPEVAEPYFHREESYKGFLLIKCEECGKIKGFCSKHEITYHQCECGHRTELRDLRPMHLNCKCGNHYKYMTNIQDENFEYTCFNSGCQIYSGSR